MSLDNELKHYGVLGMKWGVRKDDTPPKTDAQKEAEKKKKRNAKAQKYVERARRFQNEIDTIDSRKAAGKPRWLDAGTRKDLIEERDRALKDAERKKQGKLSIGQRRVVIGASVLAAIGVTAAAVSAAQSGEGRRLIEKGKAFLKGDNVQLKQNFDLAKSGLSPKELENQVLQQINPDFGEFGTTMNCRRATMAYELRRRGFDVMATRTTNADGQNTSGLMNVLNPGKNDNDGVIASIVRSTQETLKKHADTGAEYDSEFLKLSRTAAGGARNMVFLDEGQGMREVVRRLSNQPNGARGELGVKWLMGGGHSMAYEVVDGKANIFDGQTGKRYFMDQLGNLVQSKGGSVGPSDLPDIVTAGYTRLDNVPLNLDFLLKWVKNAG